MKAELKKQLLFPSNPTLALTSCYLPLGNLHLLQAVLPVLLQQVNVPITPCASLFKAYSTLPYQQSY